MEVTLLSDTCIRLKSKQAVLLVNPNDKIPKTEADGVVLYEGSNLSSKVTDYRLVIKGPGEFEVGGIKISVLKSEASLVYSMDVDGVKVLMGEGNALSRSHDKFGEADIIIVEVNSDFDPQVIAGIEPKVTVIYGNVEEAIKKFGKEATRISKFTTTSDKLPQEMEIIALS